MKATSGKIPKSVNVWVVNTAMNAIEMAFQAKKPKPRLASSYRSGFSPSSQYIFICDSRIKKLFPCRMGEVKKFTITVSEGWNK